MVWFSRCSSTLTVCNNHTWRTIYAGRYRHAEYIGVLEGRAYLWALRRAARDRSTHDTRRLFLLDNFGVVCSMTKQRSHHHCMLQFGRRAGAIQLATRILPALRWIPSEWNPADKPSRVFQPRGELGEAGGAGYVGTSQSSWRRALDEFDVHRYQYEEEAVGVGQCEDSPYGDYFAETCAVARCCAHGIVTTPSGGFVGGSGLATNTL